jgi:hypothetical protein
MGMTASLITPPMIAKIGQLAANYLAFIQLPVQALAWLGDQGTRAIAAAER